MNRIELIAKQAMWRPIEEAPKDSKTLFDVWLSDAYGGRRLADCRISGRHIVDSRGYFLEYDGQPTHYRPLPPPPGKEG